ncbi:MAG: TonB-dependent receptor [Methylococcaceae bacterium]|nr:TonB-dependent receptor [Methylococcaceae bacterium]
MSPLKHRKLFKSGPGRQAIAKAALLAVMVVQTAHGETVDGKHHFDIPAQSLNQALLSFGKQSQQQLMYGTDIAENLRSRALQGDYTAEEAIKILLSDTPLQAVTTGEGTITLQPKAVDMQNKADPQTLSTVTVVGKTSYDANDPYNPDYYIPNASTATKTDTPIMETPYTVKVVPHQVLQDQQVIRVEDALTNVAGVQTGFTNGGLNDTFSVRGFQTSTMYRDGYLLPDGSNFGASQARRETANIDHIEVLKGPGSILYGRSDPGGVINLVTKKPQATPYHSIQQQFGSYDRYRTTADSTGAITDDKQLLYRANLSYESANSFRDFVSTDSVFFAPSLTWNISDRTQANLNIEYNHFDNTLDSGIPVVGNRPAPVPRSRQIADPRNNSNVGDRTYLGFDWSHEFNDNWKLTQRFSAEYFDATQLFTFYGTPDANGNLYNAPLGMGHPRGANNGHSQQQNYFTTLNLTGKFDTGLIQHTMLWGFDYFMLDTQIASECCALGIPGDPFNIYNPSYPTTPLVHNFVKGPDRNTEWYGLYMQDQIKLPFNLFGNVGVRYDNAVGRNNGSVTTDDDRVSPRGGLLWRPQEWLSVYGNYSENFGPSNSLFNAPGQQMLSPQTAKEWELGTKTEFLEGRLTASFAYFDLIRNNLPVPDPFNPFLTRTVGQEETRGYELEAAGEILPGWRVIGAYTHLAYANINKDTGYSGLPGDIGNTGHRLYGAPRNFGSLWNTYEFQAGVVHGLKLGVGVIAASQSQGSNDNNFQTPGFATLNLLGSYSLNLAGKKLTIQLNANNVLDKTYYQGTNSANRVGVATPRTFLGSVRLEF